MRAYHGDPAIKAEYLARVRAHREADELAWGTYYEPDGRTPRMCAVGCTIHGSDHRRYELELGIPAALAHLEDAIFEGLPDDLAQAWPERFLAAIPVGADLSRASDRFLAWLLSEEIPRHFDAAARPRAAEAVARIAELRWRSADGQSALAGTAVWSAAELVASRSAEESRWELRLATYARMADRLVAIPADMG